MDGRLSSAPVRDTSAPPCYGAEMRRRRLRAPARADSLTIMNIFALFEARVREALEALTRNGTLPEGLDLVASIARYEPGMNVRAMIDPA